MEGSSPTTHGPGGRPVGPSGLNVSGTDLKKIGPERSREVRDGPEDRREGGTRGSPGTASPPHPSQPGRRGDEMWNKWWDIPWHRTGSEGGVEPSGVRTEWWSVCQEREGSVHRRVDSGCSVHTNDLHTNEPDPQPLVVYRVLTDTRVNTNTDIEVPEHCPDPDPSPVTP